MGLAIGDIAIRYGCELHGDPDVTVSRVATLAAAESGSIAFLANPAYRKQLSTSRATAVILGAKDADACSTHCLVAANPYAVFARVAQELYPEPVMRPGVHVDATVGAGCELSASCHIAAGAVLGDRVVVGENCYIGPNCVLGDDVRLGRDTQLIANVTLYHNVVLGDRCRIHAGTVIGADGFGIAPDDGGWVKVPQIGGVVLGDDVEVGSNCSIDRGAIEDTRLGNGVKLDNMVQIAHNVVIGDHTAIAGQSGVAGSATVGRRCLIGGSVAISGHIDIADDVSIMGRGSVSKSIPAKGVYSSVFAVEEAGKWRKIAARVKRLDAMAVKLRELETSVKALMANMGNKGNG